MCSTYIFQNRCCTHALNVQNMCRIIHIFYKCGHFSCVVQNLKRVIAPALRGEIPPVIYEKGCLG